MTTDLQKLLTWLSPAFPVGSFAWSAGLETAIVERVIVDRRTVQDWILGALHHGGLRTDAVLLAHAHRHFDDAARLSDLTDLSFALTPARERMVETTAMGEAFVLAAKAWPTDRPARLALPTSYPLAVGAITGSHGIDLQGTIVAFLTAIVHGQVSVALRLVPIGQTDGLTIMADLESAIANIARAVQGATLDDIGSVAYGADIAQMKHETLGTRIFRS